MKFTISILSLLFLPGIVSGVHAEEHPPGSDGKVDTFWTALSSGTVKGLLRYSAQYRDTDLLYGQDGTPPVSGAESEKKLQYSAIGGYFGYETAPWWNTSIGATIYIGQPFFPAQNPDDRNGLGGLYEDDGGQDGYIALGEAYLKIQTVAHRVVAGRQEMPDYRFVSLSDIRMSPITHEGITYENSTLPRLQFNLAYIAQQKERNDYQFISMAHAARLNTGCGNVDLNGDCLNSGSKKLLRGTYNPANYDFSGNYAGPDKGMSMAAATYSNNGVSLEGWDYYVTDFVNTLYLFGQYSFKPGLNDLTLTAAAQYVNQQDTGDSVAGGIDTWFYGVKLQTFYRGATLFAAYNEVSYNEDSYDGGTIFVRWGTPQMFNSYQVQDSELAGTRSIGIGLQYDFAAEGIAPGLLARVRHAAYNMPDDLNQIDARQDRNETTFDLRYAFKKDTVLGLFSEIEGMSIFFRMAYNSYRTDYDFAAYRRLHGYALDNGTDNFFDYRIYLDYIF